MQNAEVKPVRVLLVDENENDYLLTRHLLVNGDEHPSFEVEWAAGYEAALETIGRTDPDVCLVDYKLKKHDGVQFVREAQGRGCRSPMILLAPKERPGAGKAGLEAGIAQRFVKGSLQSSELTGLIREVVEKRKTTDALRFAQFMLEQAPDMVYFVKSDGKFHYVNETACRAMGYTKEEFLKLSLWDLDKGVTPESWNDHWHVLQKERFVAFESKNWRKDGSHIHVDVKCCYVEFDGECFNLAYTRDVTGKKVARKEAREAAERLRRQNEALTALAKSQTLTRGSLIEAVREVTKISAEMLDVDRASVWLISDDGSQIHRLNCYDRNTGQHSDGPVHSPGDYPEYAAAFERDRIVAAENALDDPRYWEIRQSYLVPHGVNSRLDASIHRNGRLVGGICHDHIGPPRAWTPDEKSSACSMADLLSHILDAHELRRAEETLRRREDEYRTIFDSLSANIFCKDRDGRIVRANKAAASAWGFSVSEIEGKTTEELFPEQADRLRADDLEVMESGKPKLGALHRLSSSSVRERWVMNDKVPQFNSAGEVIGIIGVAMDVTARVEETSARLESSRSDGDHLQSVLNSLGLAVAMLDENGFVTFMSNGCARLFGRRFRTAVGRHWREVSPFDAEGSAELGRTFVIAPRSRGKLTLRMKNRNEQTLWIEVVTHDDPRDPRRRMVFLYDVSETHDLGLLSIDKPEFEGFIGESRRMKEVYDQIRELAKIKSTVLIEGETGTGKELVARAIHEASDRKDKPFVAINCAGLTDSLLQSQLFGHRRGSFTGALRDQQGLVEAAHGGTIFLDEIGDIPPNVQTSLLRVLQEREIIRVGETRARKIDVRVLAATQFDLGRRVADGNFRADLLYRIRVGRIELPPLRRRIDDVPLLAAAFLAKRREETGKKVDSVSDEAIRIMLSHNWPGNVRELQGVIEFAAFRCQGASIGVGDLPPEIFPPEPANSPLVGAEPMDEEGKLLSALRVTGGNRKAAARLVGISRATFYRKLARLDPQSLTETKLGKPLSHTKSN